MSDFLDKLEKSDTLSSEDIETFKLDAYKTCLKRYLVQLEAFESIEQEIRDTINSKKKIDKNLIDCYKSLCKGGDLLNAQLRLLVPSKNLDINSYESILKEISDEDGNINLKTVLIFQIKEIMLNIARVKNQLPNYDCKSIEYWKLSNSLLSMLKELNSLVNTLHKVNKDIKGSEEDGFSIDELHKILEETKGFNFEFRKDDEDTELEDEQEN